MSTFTCNNCNRVYPAKGALVKCKCGKGIETLTLLNTRKEKVVSKTSSPKKKNKTTSKEIKSNTVADLE